MAKIVNHSWVDPIVPDEDDRCRYLRYKFVNGQLLRQLDVYVGTTLTTTYAFQEDEDTPSQVGDECLRIDYEVISGVKQSITCTVVTVTQEILDDTVAQTNVAPTDIAISNATIPQTTGIGEVVGTLSTFDPNTTDTHTYTIISDPDDKFEISGDSLRLKNLVDYDTATAHTITIRSTDQGLLSYDKQFVISVTESIVFTNDKATLFQGNTFNQYMEGPQSSEVLPGNVSFTANLWAKTNNPTYPNNYSMAFNGTDERIDTTADYSNKTKLTMSGWFYRTSSTRLDLSQTDNSNAQRFKLIRNSTAIFLVAGPGASISVNNSDVGVWQHIVVVYDGTQSSGSRGKIYLNGVLQTLTGASGTLPTNLGSIADLFKIGYDNGSSNYSNGKIDEVSVWDAALTLSEVQEIYNSGAPTQLTSHSKSASLLNWWKMGDDLNAPTMPDQVGADDGTLVNMDASNRSTALPGGGSLPTYKTLLYVGRDIGEDPKIAIEWNESDNLRLKYYNTSSSQVETLLVNGDFGNNTYRMFTADYDLISQVISLYVDGSIVGTASSVVMDTAGTEVFYIGTDPSKSVFYDGLMDEVSILNDHGGITDLYNGGYCSNLSLHPDAISLEAWWRMGDPPDDFTLLNGIQDATGNGHTLTAMNMSATNCVTDSVPILPTYENTASLPFNGIDQYGDTGISTDMTGSGDFSISLWYKGTTPAYIVSQAHTLGPYSSDFIIAGGGGIFWVRSKTLGNLSSINDDQWHHIVLSWNSSASTYDGYVDGVNIGTSDVVSGFGGTGSIAICTRGDFTTSFNTGKMDELSVWNKALDDTDVTEIYNLGTPSNLDEVASTGNLINWYRFGEDAGDTNTTLVDQKGSSDATLYNFSANPYDPDTPS